MEDQLIRILNALGRQWTPQRLPNGTQESSKWVLGTEFGGDRDTRGPVTISQRLLTTHSYAIGESGCGKSTWMRSGILQCVQRGDGFMLLDPHGDQAEGVVALIYSEHKRRLLSGEPGLDLDRLHLIEPFSKHVTGCRFLDPGSASVYAHVAGICATIARLWAGSYGCVQDELFRNAFITLSLTGLTLTEAVPLLTNSAFRQHVVNQLPDSQIRSFWLERFDQLSDAARLRICAPALTKLTALTADPALRGFLGQREGALDLRAKMDAGAWIVCNLAKGYLRGTAPLIGSLIVAQIQTAAMSRVDVSECDRKQFYIFVDEFQNFVGEEFEEILAEARKYKLHACLAHQTQAQMTAGMQAAVFGNVGTRVFFRVSAADATFIARGYPDSQSVAQELTSLPDRCALVHRRGLPIVRMRSLPVNDPTFDTGELAAFLDTVRQRHGRPLAAVQSEIAARVVPMAENHGLHPAATALPIGLEEADDD